VIFATNSEEFAPGLSDLNSEELAPVLSDLNLCGYEYCRIF
jgi:hypothetical protein